MMILSYNNLIRTRQLQSRNSQELQLANMGRLGKCCKLICAKQATMFVITLLIARAFKTTCSTNTVQVTPHHSHHIHHLHHQDHLQQQQQQQHQLNNQPLNSSRATTNLSLNLNLLKVGNSSQETAEAFRQSPDNQVNLSSLRGLNMAEHDDDDDERAPKVRHNYDFLGGLGEFIKLMLDELEIQEAEEDHHDALPIGSDELVKRQSINLQTDDLSDVEPTQRQHNQWPAHFMAINDEHVYGGDLIPFNFRRSLRNRRDLVMAEDDIDELSYDTHNVAKRQLNDKNLTVNVGNNRSIIPLNHRLTAQETEVQMIKSVMPVFNETHMKMVAENSIKQDHLYDDQDLIGDRQTGNQKQRNTPLSFIKPPTSKTKATGTAATVAPSLPSQTSRTGKKQSITTLSDEGAEGDTPLPPPPPDSVTDYPDTLDQADGGGSLSDRAGLKRPIENSDLQDQDVIYIENSPVNGYESDNPSSQTNQVNGSPIIGSGGDSASSRPRVSRSSRRKAQLIAAGEQASSQPPAATSMASVSRQVPPPEHNPTKETPLRSRFSDQNRPQSNGYNEAKDSANYGTIFDKDGPEELDEVIQYTRSPALNLSKQHASSANNFIPLSDRHQAVEQRRQNQPTNQLSTTDNDIMTNIIKDQNQLMQLFRMYNSTSDLTSNEKKSKKVNQLMALADNHQVYKPPNQQVIRSDNLDEMPIKPSHLSHPFSSLTAPPYAAPNLPQTNAWQTSVENYDHQHLLQAGNPSVADQQQVISQYDQTMNENQNTPLASLNAQPGQLVYPPIGTITIQSQPSPPPPISLSSSGMSQTSPLRIMPEGMRLRLEDAFYNSNNNNNPRHSKRAIADARARQIAAQLNRDSTLNDWPNYFVKSKPSRHQTNLISNTAPLSQYLNQAKQLQAANSYMSPTRNDPLQDSAQPDGGYQGVAPSLVAQNQVLGVLRAGPVAASANQQHHSPAPQSTGQLIRRALPLTVTASQMTRGRFPTLPTTAYLLPAYPASTFPYSGTSSHYARQSSGGPSQRLWSGSPHRVGRLATSASLTDEAATTAAATSDPMWSDSQGQEDDYQQAPQTIQITAVPNGGLAGGLGNGFNTFGGNWNGWGGGPWNGRQVLLVNRAPTAEWRNWILPVAAVLSLPLVLGSLLVPVFLKSVMFLIQILQMLGFLMPPAQLASQIASMTHSPPG